MKPVRSTLVPVPSKAPTGITGFDEITGGGLPRGRTTLLVGGPGSGKTIFALQFLVHGARTGREPGIFVAFEETSKRIVANAEGFGWKLAELLRKKLFFLDAQPAPDLIRSGNFDLSGMLAPTAKDTLTPAFLRDRAGVEIKGFGKVGSIGEPVIAAEDSMKAGPFGRGKPCMCLWMANRSVMQA